jgi:hypothetical protein
LRIAALTFRFLLGFWEPAPNSDHVDHKKDYVLNEERGLGFQHPFTIQAIEATMKMMKPPKKEIEARAYQLWKKAGQPEGRGDEFRHLAQQELRNEDKSSPTRIPDTL